MVHDDGTLQDTFLSSNTLKIIYHPIKSKMASFEFAILGDNALLNPSTPTDASIK